MEQSTYAISPCINNNTFNGVKKSFSDEEIIKIMKDNHYSEENFVVMSGNLQEIRKINPKLVQYNDGERQRSDSRNPIEYKMGICASWIVEDFHVNRINTYFQKLGVQAKMLLNGGDKDRIIVCDKGDVSADADFLFTYDDFKVKIEHCISYTGYFLRTEQISLRNNKYIHLRDTNSLIMAIETFGSQDKTKWRYALIGGEDLDISHCIEKESCGTYNKYGYQLCINKNWFVNFEEFCNILLNYSYFSSLKNEDKKCKHINQFDKKYWLSYIRTIVIKNKKNKNNCLAS